MHLFIQNNLECLATTPIDNLTAEGDKLRPLNSGETSNLALVQKVIQDTFAYAANCPDPYRRLWTRVERSYIPQGLIEQKLGGGRGGAVYYVSPGVIAEKIGFVSELPLPTSVEECPLVCLVIGPVSLEIPKRHYETSPMLNALLWGQFSEAHQDKIDIELPYPLEDPGIIPIAMNAIVEDRLPNDLDVNQHIDCGLFFHYFGAADLFKACSAKIMSFIGDEDLLALARLPDVIMNGVIAELPKQFALRFAESIMSSSQYFQNVVSSFSDEAKIITNASGQPIEITGKNKEWTVDIRKVIVSLLNRACPRITDSLLDYLGLDVGLLESADLSRSPAATIKRVLEVCPNLKEIIVDCEHCDLSSVLKQYPRLLRLTITHAKDDELENLYLVPKLLSLNIYECNELKDDALKHLAHVRKLEKLFILDCRPFPSDFLQYLVAVPELEKLVIPRCVNSESDFLTHLPDLLKLRFLDIAGCRLMGNFLEHLGNVVPRLRILNVASCQISNPNALDQLYKLPELQKLHR